MIPVEPLPQITSLSVDGSLAAKVRQGVGEATVHVQGQFLSHVTDVHLGSLPGRVKEATDTSLTFVVAISHGSPLGLQPLSVSAASSSRASTLGVTITPITCGPGGADAAGDGGVGTSTGTDEAPFRSIAKALSVTAAGDTIFLQDGTYDQNNGDSFATMNGKTASPNVPDGVTIKGQSRSDTKLVGPKCVGDGTTGLVLGSNTRVETLNISQFCSLAVLITPQATGTISVHDVAMHGVSGGIRIAGASNVAIDSVDIYDAVVGNENGYSPVAIALSGMPSDAADGGGSTASASVTITGGNIRQFDTGVRADSTLGTPRLTINETTFNNVGTELRIQGHWSVSARNSTFGGVIWIDDASSLDFGTKEVDGHNIFNSTGHVVDDERPAAASGSVPILVSGKRWVNVPPPPIGCTAANSSSAPHSWDIANPGTCPSNGNVIVNWKNLLQGE